jgi:hypothetical protein
VRRFSRYDALVTVPRLIKPRLRGPQASGANSSGLQVFLRLLAILFLLWLAFRLVVSAFLPPLEQVSDPNDGFVYSVLKELLRLLRF